jgi:hypothetical protein
VDLSLTNAELLYSTVQIKELTFRQYRNLLKCFLGDDIDPKIVFLNINKILEQTTNLSRDEINLLTFIDYILLLLYIRSYSIGDDLFLITDNNERQIRIELSLFNIITDIKKTFNLKTTLNITKNVQFELKYPTITELFLLEENKNFYLANSFIKSINVNENNLYFDKLSFKERQKIIQTLPAKLLLTLNKEIESHLVTVNSFNFFNTVNTNLFYRHLPLIPDTKIISFIIKLLFDNSLENIYDNIFALTKVCNFTGEYLDNCTPGEFFLYTKKLEELFMRQNKKTNLPDADISDDSEFTDDEIEDNEESADNNQTNYFDDLPPITSEINVSDFRG